MRSIILFLVILHVQFSFSQDYIIEWKKEKTQNQVRSAIYSMKDTYVTAPAKDNKLDRSFTYYNSDLEIVNSEDLDGLSRGSCLLGGNILGLYSSNRGHSDHLSFLLLDSEEGNVLKTGEIPFENGNYGTYQVKNSPIVVNSANQDYCAVVNFLKLTNGIAEFSYVIFDADVEVVEKGYFSISMPDSFDLGYVRWEINIALVNISEVDQVFLSDKGELFVCTKHKTFSKAENKNPTTKLYRIREGSAEEIPLSFANNEVKRIKILESISEGVNVIGTYGPSYSEDVLGLFTGKLNLNNGEFSKVTFNKLSDQIGNPNWLEFLANVGGVTSDYGIRNVYEYNDGARIVTIENIRKSIRSGNLGEGVVGTMVEVHYNSLICLRLNNVGEIDWVQGLEKYQMGYITNTNHFFSIVEGISNDKLVIFMNDELKNYDLSAGDRAFIPTDINRSEERLTWLDLGMAVVEIDLKTGDLLSRRMLEDNTTGNRLVRPSSSFFDPINNRLLIEGVKKKKQQFPVTYGKGNFGIISF